MSIDLTGYAYSFAHAIIKCDDRQFTGIRAVHVNQDLQESAVYGTNIGPMKRSLGQLQMGRGQLIFSDYEEGTDFWAHLAPQPFRRLWTLDYALVKEDGSVRSVECRACRLTGIGIEHEAGADALGVSYPFSFMSMQLDGIDTALTPKGLAQAGINIAQNLLNLT